MRRIYRVALCSSVASAALMLAAPAALAQTVVNQSATNSGAVSNPPAPPGGANTIDMGGGGLGVGASVSTSAGGAVVSTSVTGINSQFVNPTGGFGAVTQGAQNDPTGAITNGGAIANVSGAADSGSSLSISARGAGASFSIVAVGGIPFQPVATVGNIAQGFAAPAASPPVINAGNVINLGEITGPSGGPALDLSGMGASASVSAGGAQSSVSLSAMGATTFTGTSFGTITQAPNNAPSGGVFNTLTAGGISLGALSGDGASASTSATGAAASVSLSYIDTTNWSPTQIVSIFQNPQNNAINVSNNRSGNSGITAGVISGDGASVRSTAAGAFAGVSYSTIGSSAAAGPTGQTLGNVGQLVTSTGNVYSDGVFTATSLTGVGSAIVASAVGAGASFAVSSIGDTSTASLTTAATTVIPITQQVANTGTNITNFGQVSVGAISGNGAAVSMSATGAQASVSVSAINTTAFTTPWATALQTVSNGSVGNPAAVNNNSTGVTTGNLSGHGSSVSVGATGAVASIGYSFINTTAWSSFPTGANQAATNVGAISNVPNVDTISVGSLSGTGASVRASAAGAVASVSVNSILSGPPATNLLGSAGIQQMAINTGAITNRASIVSTGTLSGMGSSASISATGAATSVAVASIADTVVMPPPTATITNITQTSTNNIASPVTNTGSITLAGGNLGIGAAASISAVGASAAISFLAVK
ncbi:MAG: hypothetical protein AB1490_12480 [Pseudomonadota bacterium]